MCQVLSSYVVFIPCASEQGMIFVKQVLDLRYDVKFLVVKWF